MPYLDIRTAVTTVEQALVDALSLALSARHPAVPDLAALAAVRSVPIAGGGDVIPTGTLRYVQAEGVVYRWRKFSQNAQALPYVVLPADRGTTSRGRWERCQSTVTYGPNYYAPVHRVQSGYAKAVQLWQGDEGLDASRDRIYGQSPAFLVRWDGDDLRMKANHPRGLNEVDMPFEVWCWARNLRGEWEALEGSPVASEAQAEPGLWRMMGDARYILAGSDLGLSPGIRYIDIQGTGHIIEENLTERRFCGMVPILVKASLDIPDEDLVPIGDVSVQFEQAEVAGPQADPLNHIAQGYGLAAAAGLVAEPQPGVAYVAGQVVSSTPPPHTFSASSDTYRDLRPDGTIVYTAVPIGTDPSQVPQLPGTLRLGVTRTDASNILGDSYLCDVVVPRGGPFDCPVS